MRIIVLTLLMQFAVCANSQTFELTDFSYDAVLRFALANSTAEAINSTDDFYETIMKNSSMTTVLVMIILDIVSIYIVPGMKIIFVVLIFLSSLLVVLTSIFRVNSEKSVLVRLWHALLKPMILFFLLSVVVTYIISQFMSKANTKVTGTELTTFQFGDPTTTMLALLVINIASVVFYWKILKGLWSEVRDMGSGVGGFVSGVVGGAAGAIVATVAAGAAIGKAASNKGASAVRSVGRASKRAKSRADKANVVDKEEAKQEDRLSKKDQRKLQEDMDKADQTSEAYSKKRADEINKATKEGQDMISKGSETTSGAGDAIKASKTEAVNVNDAPAKEAPKKDSPE